MLLRLIMEDIKDVVLILIVKGYYTIKYIRNNWTKEDSVDTLSGAGYLVVAYLFVVIMSLL